MGSFKSPDRTLRDQQDQLLNFPVNGQCGERRSPKVQPSNRPGIEPGTSWLAVRDLTNCAKPRTHTYHVTLILTIPKFLSTDSLWYSSACLFWLKKFLYTLLQPNRKISLSSVMEPWVSPSMSRAAHCASASIGLTINGTPNKRSSSWTTMIII